jgi:serine/threonine-protein kinase
MTPASARAPQQRIGVYVLLERLGSGGLGEVWKARDPRLNRIVALKFLSAETTHGAPGRELLREARAASALNHANIVTIFEIGESEGATYLAMEFVEGETLRARLERPPVAFEEALDIATQMALGLAAAHRHGIVHRDLKPENVVLRVDGCVKLVDFGLAKQLPWSEASTMDSAPGSATESGQIVGTFHYMSPEQARGQRVTPASDAFSFGIVLYEMLTGEHPFRAATPMDTLSAILHKEPQPASARTPAVPPPVAEVVTRALEKEPSRRYPSAIELAEALKTARTSSSSVPLPAPSVVRPQSRSMRVIGIVLLAAVLGGGVWVTQSQRWFGDSGSEQSIQVESLAVMSLQAPREDSTAVFLAESLADDLSVALARVGLRVASRSTVQAAPAAASPREMGAQLGVDAVLTGTIRSFGTRLRVHVELVNTRTGFQIWSTSATLDSAEVMSGEPRVAADLASQLAEALAKR